MRESDNAIGYAREVSSSGFTQTREISGSGFTQAASPTFLGVLVGPCSAALSGRTRVATVLGRANGKSCDPKQFITILFIANRQRRDPNADVNLHYCGVNYGVDTPVKIASE